MSAIHSILHVMSSEKVWRNILQKMLPVFALVHVMTSTCGIDIILSHALHHNVHLVK